MIGGGEGDYHETFRPRAAPRMQRMQRTPPARATDTAATGTSPLPAQIVSFIRTAQLSGERNGCWHRHLDDPYILVRRLLSSTEPLVKIITPRRTLKTISMIAYCGHWIKQPEAQGKSLVFICVGSRACTMKIDRMKEFSGLTSADGKFTVGEANVFIVTDMPPLRGCDVDVLLVDDVCDRSMFTACLAAYPTKVIIVTARPSLVSMSETDGGWERIYCPEYVCKTCGPTNEKDGLAPGWPYWR